MGGAVGSAVGSGVGSAVGGSVVTGSVGVAAVASGADESSPHDAATAAATAVAMKLRRLIGCDESDTRWLPPGTVVTAHLVTPRGVPLPAGFLRRRA